MIYFDSAASAVPDEETIRFFASSLAENAANQEAAHRLGYQMRSRISDAEKQLSLAVTGCDRWHVLWCHSGTDAFNLFTASLPAAGHVVTSAMEHPALAAAIRRIDPDAEILYPEKQTGRIHPGTGHAGITAFHLVQSETGVIQDTEQLFDAYPHALHFMDAVQGALKIPLPVGNAHIIAVSGNKFGAPGCAALLISPDWQDAEKFLKNAHYARHINYLAGRVPVPAIASCAFAAERRSRSLEQDLQQAQRINSLLREGCLQLKLRPTIPQQYASPWILHVTAPGYQGGVLVRMLSEEGVCVSSGSACASETKNPSPALTALGFNKADAFSGLRFSFDRNTTEEEAKKLLSSLEKVLKNY